MSYPMPPESILSLIRRGTVIPASPLALNSRREFDPCRQTALMRYYCQAGAGGVAVGVHTTQFAIRNPEVDLFETVLQTCAQALDEYTRQSGRPVIKIAGIVGRTAQAAREAETALSHGYHAGLLSLSAFGSAPISEMIDHAEEIARLIPLFGFYLQPSVGGRVLPLEFWRKFVLIPNVVAIKIAPFNRYQTFDVIRAVAEEGLENDIALYTGNDDHIITDLITPWTFTVSGNRKILRIRGGLLGQWAVGTKRAVEMLTEIHDLLDTGSDIHPDMLKRNVELTDANAALFDAAHQFRGVIPGVHEVLRRSGLLEGIWTLNPDEGLSEGQFDEIERVLHTYPHLFDDTFIEENRDSWLT
ncbi:MAG: dihydrodipicolinate synthase family protein [Candidatus Latescibacter sp.]|nr:dihydrodipicolinate synthase family protein [Candidatus Latescibacter sp.]